MPEYAIQSQEIDKRYPNSEGLALNSVSLEVESGSFFGLLGPNGSGKTTLISILCALIPASAGSAKIYGYDIIKESKKIKPLIGLVPQKIALYPSLTLYENLHLFASLYGLTQQEISQRIQECLEIVELTHVANKCVSTFSGGMMRRANLAAGLLHKPKLLFLDEPTANVDAHARNMIFKSLQAINQTGVTIIYTTHYMEEIEILCSQIAILNKGIITVADSINHLKQQYSDKKSLSEIYLSLTES